jgi:hypothetical protein
MNVPATKLTSSKWSGVQRILLAEILRSNLLEIFPEYTTMYRILSIEYNENKA